MHVFGGRTLWAEGTANAKIERQEHAWHVPRTAGRLVWLE